MIDLDFNGHNTLYATHGLHSYAAKCPPQLAKYGIEEFSSPGETILDPMVGSGTTIVEAKLCGRHSIGVDIDPLACLIAQVKSREVSDDGIAKASKLVIEQTRNDVDALENGKVTQEILDRATPPVFPNLNYWFEPKVKNALAVLSYHISNNQMPDEIRDFLWVAFSAIILTKVSVANARDIIHSRHHHYFHPEIPDVIKKFETRITNSIVKLGDARGLSLGEESVDMVFTSPPYATALDYPRAHFLAVGWLSNSLGISFEEYKLKGATYIGSERGCQKGNYIPDNKLSKFNLAQSITNQLSECDPHKARLMRRYFSDMYQSLREINRVLKPSRHAVIVICPSHIRKIEVKTHKVFIEMANEMGFKLVNELTRTINKNRRVLPYMQEVFGNRMNTEYILVFQKAGNGYACHR
jgi:DNA modification methylase